VIHKAYVKFSKGSCYTYQNNETTKPYIASNSTPMSLLLQTQMADCKYCPSAAWIRISLDFYWHLLNCCTLVLCMEAPDAVGDALQPWDLCLILAGYSMDMLAPSIKMMVNDCSMLKRAHMCSPAAPQEGALQAVAAMKGLGWVAFTLDWAASGPSRLCHPTWRGKVWGTWSEVMPSYVSFSQVMLISARLSEVKGI